jgi:asparagine synthase (glutamine-hydrolysing)
MSGVFGFIRLDGSPADAAELTRQKKALAHLGPDGADQWREGPAGLGAVRLRVTQEDCADRQPLVDPDSGLAFVADARLDNRDEIAAALGVDAAVAPDSFLMFAAFKRWGGDCAARFVGDFVFAAWDPRRRELTLARDHMGQRGVFYHAGAALFAFASEIKGLWALAEAPRALDETAFAQTVSRGAPPETGATLFVGVRALRGGEILTLDATTGAATTRRYWEPRADPAHLGRDDAYYIDAYRRILDEAVACRLRRTLAPAAVLMGGGFDTAAICALAGPVVTAQARKFIAACSVMPADYAGPIGDARKWAEICRRHMPHLDMRYVTSEKLDLLDGMERSFAQRDNHHGVNRAVTSALFKEIAACGARVVMDGYGGDYTLNPRGTGAVARLLRRGRFWSFLKEFSATRRRRGETLKQAVARHVLTPFLPFRWMQALHRFRAGVTPFGARAPLAERHVRVAHRSDPRTRLTPVNEAIEYALRRQQNFPSAGFSTSAASFGLVFTQPFHDKRVVEFALAIPERLRYRDGKERFLALAALGDLYPPEFADRPPGNDYINPDFPAMALRAKARMLSDIDRMESSARLTQMFDFPRLRAMLQLADDDDSALRYEEATIIAATTYIAARYVEWFRRDNA